MTEPTSVIAGRPGARPVPASAAPPAGRPDPRPPAARRSSRGPRRAAVAGRPGRALVIALVAMAAASCAGDEAAPTASADPAVTASTPGAVATTPTPTPSARGPITSDLTTDPAVALTIGRADAPVVMVEYSDFQCPFCRRFAVETEPELIARYVDTGVLRIEWRDFAYLGNESLWAAQAARAAGRQGKFWEYHARLFQDQGSPNSGWVSAEYLEGVAVDLGLDLVAFRADLAAAGTYDAIEADFRSGVAAGVTGTPAFFVNGTPVFGAHPLEVFVEVIEEAAGLGVTPNT